jgi:hypothetical protein
MRNRSEKRNSPIHLQDVMSARSFSTYTIAEGRAIAQAVSHWLPTVAARVQARSRSHEICGKQSGTGAGFLRVLRFLYLGLVQ